MRSKCSYNLRQVNCYSSCWSAQRMIQLCVEVTFQGHYRQKYLQLDMLMKVYVFRKTFPFHY